MQLATMTHDAFWSVCIYLAVGCGALRSAPRERLGTKKKHERRLPPVAVATLAAAAAAAVAASPILLPLLQQLLLACVW
jgi:hypothetical protein